MSDAAAHDAAVIDAGLALALFLSAPLRFGGIVLRGDGPVRDAMVDHARAVLAVRGAVARIPANIDAERLLGGLDLTATLANGVPVQRPGLLAASAGGVIILPMAERTPEHVAAMLAQALDERSLAVIMLDDGNGTEEAPAALLTERVAFHCDVSGQRTFAPLASDAFPGPDLVAALAPEQRAALAATAVALGIASVRPLLYAEAAARACAALHGRTAAADEDIAAAVRLVLAPRATQRPEPAPPPDAPPSEPRPEPPSGNDAGDCERPALDNIDLADILLEAAVAAIPAHILDTLTGRAPRGGRASAGRAGQKQRSAQRGRPLGARAGVPGQGRRLALLATLRAAAPWQTIRRQAAGAEPARRVAVRKSDLHIRRFEQRASSLTIFAVDASGSSALARLAEAKGAVELMLAQAYVKRSQVALIAFRQAGAEVLLPPTRSLTRARRALAALPGGGGTPLAAGLLAAQQLAEVAARSGQTPAIAVLTDGKANVAMDGSANRQIAMAEAETAARQVAASGTHCIVIDISPRPRAEAAALAAQLGGRYLPLPQAGSAAMVSAIEQL